LVVGNPTTAPKPYPSLPAAEHEARTVVKVLERQTTLSVYSLLNKDARTIVSELLARPYRVVHIAAHGEPGPDGGVVLSGNAYLSAKEIRSMRVVPELVFLNCCHLAARTPELALAGASYDRASFAANAADSL